MNIALFADKLHYPDVALVTDLITITYKKLAKNMCEHHSLPFCSESYPHTIRMSTHVLPSLLLNRSPASYKCKMQQEAKKHEFKSYIMQVFSMK